MKSLLLSDLFNVSSILKQLLFAVVIVSVSMLYNSGAGAYIVFCTVLCAIMTVNLFSMDERSKWLKYAFVMPITKKEYIWAKYTMSALFLCSGLIIATVLVVVCGKAGIIDMLPVKEWMAYIGAGIGVGFLFVSIYIPVLVRYGSEKSRFIVLGIIMLPTMVLLLGTRVISQPAPNWIVQAGTKIGAFLNNREYLLLVVVACILAISISISLKWMEQKEF